MILPRCPDCAGEAALIGPIAATDIFAGRTLEHLLPGGNLYRCEECSLGFRWPRLGKNELDALYTKGNQMAWTQPMNSRRDWKIARSWVESAIPAESRILDVGCFDGGFLEPLIGVYRCYGIEIHPDARNRAEEKGIEIIGSDFSAITGSFDCITAFDIVEHVESPKSFIVDCLAAVKPGGWLLISTGNLDAFSFRFMGSRYWYCTIAEHVSFVSPAWFLGLANTLDFRIERKAIYSHVDVSLKQRVKEVIKNLLYRYASPGFRKLRKLGMGGKNVKAHLELANHPPSWMSASDHFMVFLQKK